MVWIESHQSLLHHRKTGRLARRLALAKVTVIGHLHCFWWWCMDNAPGGDLTAIDAEDIADGAGWEGDPHEFFQALIHAGFVEGNDGSGYWRVHDWHDYAGKLIERRKVDAERKRGDRRERRPPTRAGGTPQDVPAPVATPRAPVQRTSSGRPADGVRTVPNLTVPNPTVVPPLTPPPEPGTSPPAASGDAPASHQQPEPRPVRPVPKAKDRPPPPDELPLWDALTAGIGVSPVTVAERGLYGGAVKQLRALGATGDDVLSRCANYRLTWPDMDLTVPALLKHWSRMQHPPPRDKLHGRGQHGPTARNVAALKEAF